MELEPESVEIAVTVFFWITTLGLLATGLGVTTLTTGITVLGLSGIWVLRKIAGVVFGLATGFGATTVLIVTLLFTAEVRAGTTATAEAQIVTLEPFTWEPTELVPEAPPEFLHAANEGSGAKTRSEIIKLNPTKDCILN